MSEVRAVTYVSFAIPRRSLGVLILKGELNVSEAILEANRLKLNPGGQVIAVSCKETDTDVPKELFEAMWSNRNRLIPEVEARILFEAASIRDWDGTVVQS
jgi:hypothetical protein